MAILNSAIKCDAVKLCSTWDVNHPLPKVSLGHSTGKCHFSFQPQRKALPRNAQTTFKLRLFLFPGAQLVKNPLAMLETWVQPLGWEDPLEKGSYPLQHSDLENPMDCIAQGVAKNWT